MLRAYWKSVGNVDTVVVTFQADPPIKVELDAVEVDDILKNLGELRVMMRPEHATDFPDAQEASTIFNPGWTCEDEPVLAHSVLRIRDPRFGWLHYVIPRDVGDQLAEALTTHRRFVRH